ncbi:MAG: DUF1631 family protein [Candidatus Thiodiazotropha sp. (ex Monitilora ramsayi)]|nr:DUF1631 family protein [Candidatus Thiodiazotropha sp. (ex Monitilora ramsayi)]
MNRRRHPRLDIDHSAIFEYHGERFDACRLLNFSRGGVYLQLADTQLQAYLPDGYYAEHERQQGILEIQPEGVRAEVSIVYLRQHGLGVSFDDANASTLFDTLMASLQAKTKERETTQSGDNSDPDPVLVRRLLQQLRGKSSDYLYSALQNFFTQALEDLLEHTKENIDSKEESATFFAYNTLEKNQTALNTDFRVFVDRGLAELVGEAVEERECKEDEPIELALVEKQEVDAWILFNDMARRVGDDVSTKLAQLEAAFSYLFQGDIRNEINPLSPISLLANLRTQLDNYDLGMQSIQIILAAFQKAVLNDLNYHYDDLLQLLKHQVADVPSQRSSDAWSIVDSQGQVIRQAADRATQQLNSLANLHQPGADGAMRDDLPVAEQKEVIASLDSLAELQNTSLLQQLENLLQREAAEPVSLPAEARAAVGAGEELVATLCNDALVVPELRELLGHLKILIIESILQDPSLLENTEHPVRRLLVAIESMMPYMSALQHPSRVKDGDRKKLSEIIKFVELGKIHTVDEATEKILTLQQEKRERFEKNRELAISRCEKDERLKQAHASVHEVLGRQLLNQSVSIAIDKLFGFGWANLLVQTHVLKGEESASWKAYLRVIDILLKIFDGDKGGKGLPEKQARDLVSLIRKGFRDYPVYATGSKAFALELQQALLEAGAGFDLFAQQRIVVDEAYLVKQFTGIPTQSTNQISGEISDVWLERTGNLSLDEWFVVKDEKNESGLLNLAWKNPAETRYLLVDGDGFKALDMGHEGLAKLLERQDIEVMQSQHEPIVDRAIDKILSRSYEAVSDESAIDSLTGLMNRRAFDQEIRKRLTNALEQQYVLVLLDLDKFQAVNDLCGFDGGDNLLRSLSSILISYLPDQGVVARIGDDEFVLLIEGQNLEQGYQTAETLRQAIEEYQYEWEDRLIPVSASIGLVHVETDEHTPGELLQAALAACNMAKKGGRNCTRIYLADDTAYQEQKEMVQSLPGIKEALAKDRMVLFAQPIMPLNPDLGLVPHYEILLRIRSDAGELESPVSFIRAAEHYDMMRAVDRWVVSAFFRAIAPYSNSLDNNVSFSINLSGKSTGDDEFKLFLKQTIDESGVDSGYLGFEITETALVGDISDTAAFIEEIRQMGCSFSLDDFGSGYASFSYLKDFPVDYVKIDGIFVKEILNKPADYAMVNSITEIAHFMDKQVIAEFVSDAETAEALAAIGVDYGQGYHFAKPRLLSDILDEITSPQSPIPVSEQA